MDGRRGLSVLEGILAFTRGYLTYAAAGALIALLAGCSGAAQPGAQHFMPSALHRATSGGDLLYVSDSGTNQVYVFSYPDGTLVQTLSGFKTPLHECSDTAGNVFITNTAKSEILEYAHGGDTPIATLRDAQQFPVDCAVDPVTHNLAVTNYGVKRSQTGSVSIYAKSKGTAKKHRDPAAIAYLFCAYDNKGNLFVTGLDYKYNLVFLELPARKERVRTNRPQANVFGLGRRTVGRAKHNDWRWCRYGLPFRHPEQ